MQSKIRPTNTIHIPFNKTHLTGKELQYINLANQSGKLCGDGSFTKKCHEWFMKKIKAHALLTHSCTGALEIMALLADIQPGDEIIMPSFTFVSTANAFVLRGGVPVFVDVREDTLNINEKLIESAITKRTKAIMVVHYAGIACEMDSIIKIAKKHSLLLFEDAAQALLAKYKGEFLGTIGDLGAFSFHDTKNIISGEGGSLVINNLKFLERSEIIREKGTNRSKFLRGEVDKYTWVDIGSSFLPSEVTAAFLYSQLEHAEKINAKRTRIWYRYHLGLEYLEEKGYLRRPSIPIESEINGHLYYIRTKNLETRNKLIDFLRSYGIYSVFHYVPLHSSPAGKKYGRCEGEMNVTDNAWETLIRLPLYYGLKIKEIDEVIDVITKFFVK